MTIAVASGLCLAAIGNETGVLYKSAGIDTTFIFLLIVGISAIANWLQSRRKAKEESSSQDPSKWETSQSKREHERKPAGEAREASRPAKSFNWEDELRKMLGEEVFPPRPESAGDGDLAPPPRATPEPVLPPRKPLDATPAVALTALDLIRLQDQPAQGKSAPLTGIKCKRRAAGSVEKRQAIRFLRDAQTVRQAIIASVVLGPPKTLEDEPPIR